MKPPTRTTLILVTAARIARADFDGGPAACKAAARPAGSSFTEAVRAALALPTPAGGGGAGTAWVLGEDVFEHNVQLGAAQVAGLSAADLARALSFEVEPFSGIPVAAAITGYHRGTDGVFDVIEVSRTDLDLVQRAVRGAGGRLAGIAYTGAAPADEEALAAWLAAWLPRLLGGALPLIRPPVAPPSKNRFLYAGLAMEAGVLLLLFAMAGWTALQRNALETRNN
ncbi:MAG: hypothetical protein JWO94_1567, partial [Verrucomicrobiaceae bacterium]|nr:hypothetical protein [Verrucomicrobiaceae bacterium]